MIEAEGLTKSFDTFLAVDQVNLQVPAGKVLVLLGPNGAGKTTTVRMLTSILRPSQGWAKVAGFDVVEEADRVRGAVGVLTEHHGLYVRMNAVEYLDFFGRLYRLPADLIKQRSNELLEKFGLTDARKKRLGEYSKGMRQKLALVRALLHDPRVLLLDEPTSAMDPESARMVREAIKGMRSAERTILLCTHNLSEAEELADQLAIIQKGRIIFSGGVEDLKDAQFGLAEYEVAFAEPGSWIGQLPTGVELIGTEDHRMRFRVSNPRQNNAKLLQVLLSHECNVITFQQVPRSLEEAYVKTLHQNEGARHVD